MSVKIAPSILSADFGKLNEEIASIEDHVDFVHVDVMDGHFVPNLTIGAPVVKNIKTKLPLDVHLMIEHPEKFIEDFAKAGSDYLTVHYEVAHDLDDLLKMIKEKGMKPGVSIKPATPVEVLEPYLKLIDWVLVMSVEPGFGGQGFIPGALDKMKWLKQRREEEGLDFLIAVDGGVKDDTGKQCVEAGADVLIAGSYIFGAEDRVKAIKSLCG